MYVAILQVAQTRSSNSERTNKKFKILSLSIIPFLSYLSYELKSQSEQKPV